MKDKRIDFDALKLDWKAFSTKSACVGEQPGITDSASIGSSSSHHPDSLNRMKNIGPQKGASGRVRAESTGGAAGPKPEVKAEEPVNPRPDLAETIGKLNESGFTFSINGKAAGVTDICALYGKESHPQQKSITVQKGREHFATLPVGDDDIEALAYFYQLGPSEGLKEPEKARLLSEIRLSGKCKNFTANTGNPLSLYSAACALDKGGTGGKSVDLATQDGTTFKIKSGMDLLRTSVLLGISPPAVLPQAERTALLFMADLEENRVKITGPAGRETVSLLDVLKAAADNAGGAYVMDGGGRLSEITSFKDLEQAHRIMSSSLLEGLDEKEQATCVLAQDLLDRGAFLSVTEYDRIPCGITTVMKALHGEDRLSQSLYFRLGNKRAVRIDSFHDLERIKALHFGGDVSSLPPEEQRILSLLEKIRADRSQEWSINKGPLGFLKTVADKKGDGSLDHVGAIWKDNDQYEMIENPEDLERFVACYIDGDAGRFSPGERKALQQIRTIREAGSQFKRGALKCHPSEEHLRYMDLDILKRLKGNSAQVDSAFFLYALNVLMGDHDAVQLYHLQDLQRFVALIVKKDMSLLPPGDRALIEQFKKLEDHGLVFEMRRDNDSTHLSRYDEKDLLAFLQGINGECGFLGVSSENIPQGLPFDPSGWTLKAPQDLTRLGALCFNEGMEKLPQAEQERIKRITLMDGLGFSPALLKNGKVEGLYPLEYLREAAAGGDGLGFTGPDGIFIQFKRLNDFTLFKAIYQSEGLSSLPPQDRKNAELLREIMGRGYSVQGDATQFPARWITGGPVTIDLFTACKALKEGDKTIWLSRDGATVSLDAYRNYGFVNDSELPDTLSPQDQRRALVIRELKADGYTFMGDRKKFQGAGKIKEEVALDPTTVFQALKEGYTDIWVTNKGKRTPLSEYLQLSGDRNGPPPEILVEDEGFLVIDNFRLDLRDRK